MKESKLDEEQSMLINETAVEKFGWKKNPLGGKYVFTDRDGKTVKLNVVGVVKDFSLGVSYQTINPLIIFLNNRGGANLYVRINENGTFDAIADIKAAWNKLFPGYELEFSFLDQSLNSLYEKEEKFLNLLTAFSFIIILIASLGIVGLISFTAELKKKEIAVRKVLGSPPLGIILLLSKKLGTLLLLANAAALPATYYLIGLWLNNFVYHIELGIWPFITSLFICLFSL